MTSVLNALAAAATHAPEGAADAAEHAEGGLPQLDIATYPSQLFWLLVAFGVLYVLLSRVFLPRLSALIEERRDRIADDLDTAAGLRGEAEDAGKSLEAALADARARAHAIVAKQREKMTAEIDAETSQAEARLQERLDAAEATIAERKQAALSKVSEVAADAAAALVDKLIGVTPDQAEVSQALAAASGEPRA